MNKIEIKNEELDIDLTINVKDTWDEIYLQDYLSLIQIVTDKDKYEDEIFFIKMLAVIGDAPESELMNLPVGELNRFIDIFTIFSKLDLVPQKIDFLDIDGVMYVPKKNMSNLTTSEIIYIKTIQRNNVSLSDVYLGMLAILFRPGYVKEDEGRTRYIQYKLNDEDIEERKELLKTKLPARVAMSLVSDFTSGTTE